MMLADVGILDLMGQRRGLPSARDKDLELKREDR
jgi:hypothetical protein